MGTDKGRCALRLVCVGRVDSRKTHDTWQSDRGVGWLGWPQHMCCTTAHGGW